eukprot:CAMPEP_0170338312 /NCGR_PEP_ID=MMETSP0116_2-20130129/70203_1 /TAXON_ID=400756 /ORGANISM="Durinskia baltica, Strain CSIRO CS-38" /LENGTH=319 /DNA_ID=CAMNT_0010591709 /DNA_START=50 /DNA_END=1006 /DNA_ORIENTATION=-
MSRACLMSGKTTGRQISALQTKFPENNTCLVCEEQAPGYVCMDFKTFVCQTCADVHREFGHKISSILHSDWDGEEYTLIEKVGGNKRAVKNWLAFYNPEDFPRPARTDEEKVKAFIRKAFVIKCWQRQPTRGRTPSGAIIANVCEDEGAEEAPADNDNWACFPPVEEGLTFNALTFDAAAGCPGRILEVRRRRGKGIGCEATCGECIRLFAHGQCMLLRRPRLLSEAPEAGGQSTSLPRLQRDFEHELLHLGLLPGMLEPEIGVPYLRRILRTSARGGANAGATMLVVGGSESTEAPPTSVKVDFSSDGEGVLDASSGA